MKPYKTLKLTEYPDVQDIISEGRRSAVGGKPYCSSKKKKLIRRYLKRADKARELKLILSEEV